MQITEFAKYINLATLAVVGIEDTEYRVYKYKGKVSKVDNVLILICHEKN